MDKPVEEILKVLKGDEYEIACSLHELGKALNLVIEPREGAKCYRIQYSTKKPKRSIFTIECGEKKFRVKASLYNLEKYKEVAEKCSDKLKECIKKTRTCERCNPKCSQGSLFHLDGKEYFTCIGSGHFFTNMDKKDWEDLKELIIKENEVILSGNK